MKISVCMATYNGAKFLREQIDSILPQLTNDDELIISDDGSTDETLEIATGYKDNRIKIYHSEYKNVIFNFENALNYASGDIIVLSDQDDIWRDDRIKKSVTALENCVLVFSNAFVFEEGSSNIGNLLFAKEHLTGFFKNLLKNNYIGATMAFRRELLKDALPFPKRIPMHDMWLGLLAEMKGETMYIEEPLIYYRRHSTNVSTTGSKSGNSFIKKMKYRMWILFLLCKRSF